MSEESNQMQIEWREEVRDSLRNLTRTVEKIKDNQKVYATVDRTDALDARVACLESDKKMIVGIAVALQFVGGCVIWLFMRISDQFK